MSAKDCTSFSLNDSYQNDALLIDNKQFNNLNLNQNFKCSNLIPVQSKTVFSKKQDFNDSDSFRKSGRNTELLFNKDTTPIGFLGSAVEKDPMPFKSGSSLGNNILRYENFVEPFLPATVLSTKKSVNDRLLWITSSSINTSFEFPRQQENDENKEPEIAHFQAGQQLLNPNEIPTMGTMETQSEDIPTNVEGEKENDALQMENLITNATVFSIEDEERLKAGGFKIKDEDIEEFIKKYPRNFGEDEPKRNDLIDSFRIIAKIGSGAAGSVFLAERQNLLYAIKYSECPDDLENEYAIATRCSSAPHIVKAFYFGKKDKHGFMVMALHGPDLREHLMAILDNENEKSEEAIKACCRYFVKCMKALEEMHKLQIMHQDVKLPNFVVGLKNPADVFLVDFSHSRDVRHGYCIEGLLGTPPFESRDALTFAKQSFKSDLESMLYSMVEVIKGLNLFLEGPILEQKCKVFNDVEMRKKFLENVPHQFNEIMNIIDGLVPESPVNYQKIIALLQEAADEETLLDKDAKILPPAPIPRPSTPPHSNHQNQILVPENSAPVTPPQCATNIDEKTLPCESVLPDAIPKEMPPTASPSNLSQSSEAQIPHSTQPNDSGKEEPYVWFKNQKKGLSIKQGAYVFYRERGNAIKHGNWDSPRYKYRFKCKNDKCHFKIDVDTEEYERAEHGKQVNIIGIDENYPNHECIE